MLDSLIKENNDGYNIYYGVLPRIREGGKEKDVEWIAALWADLDAKDYSGGKDEALQNVLSFPIKPSIIVDSGHGFHSYWLLHPEKIADVTKVKGIMKGIGKTMGADSVFDLSRILRLPGFYNQKHPEEKLICKILEEHFHPENIYGLSDFEKYFIDPGEKNMPIAIDEIPTDAELPERFIQLLKEDSLLESTWEGARVFSNKTSRSEFDCSIAVQLVKKGFTDSEIFIILRNAPSGKGTGANKKYLELTIGKAKQYANHSDDFESLLKNIDPKTPKEKVIPLLFPLYESLARNTDESSGVLFVKERVREHFGVTVRDVGPYVKRFKEVRKNIVARMIADRQELELAGMSVDKIELTDEERAEAEAFLKRPDLLEEIKRDIERIGVVGEDNNKTMLYLFMLTRKLQRPINTTIRATSGVGKSNLVSKILSLVPEEDVVRYTRITQRFLDYQDEFSLQYKILLIEERAGSEAADYSIRMIEDDTDPRIELGYLKKDDAGNLLPERRVVQGPTMTVQTTTILEMNAENESREFAVYLDESEDQRKRVHKYIRQSGLPHIALRTDEIKAIQKKHWNAQRIINPYQIVIPFAELIDFPTGRPRSSRDLKRFLNVNHASALLHQYQRPKVMIGAVEYLLVTVRDYAIAYSHIRDILEDAFSELNPTSLELLQAAKELQRDLLNAAVQKNPVDIFSMETRFTRGDLERKLGWDKTKVVRAVEPLENAGYLDFNSRGKPFKYSVVEEGIVQNAINIILTPDALLKKIHENRDKIDPIYGEEWLQT